MLFSHTVVKLDQALEALMLYLITLEIPPFPLMSSNVTLKLYYLLSINTTVQRIRNIVPLHYINSLID